jgi:tetratricopeptide (TPR) repeat protein
MKPGVVLLVSLAVTACGSEKSEERLGDAAAAAGRWDAAYTHWQEAGDEVRVLAKRADAALRLGRHNAAAIEFARVGRRDSTRVGEAAAGLARTATAASQAGDGLAAATAVGALAEIAPDWPAGRLAMSVRLADFPAGEDVLRLAPAVLAAVPTREVANRGLLAWARAEHEAGRCGEALGLYRAVELRDDNALLSEAARGVASCSSRIGLELLEAGHNEAARKAFEDAVQRDPDGAAGRRALIGLGDVLLIDGDLFQAQLAWRTAASTGGQTDSITTLALERLRASEVVDSAGESGIP